MTANLRVTMIQADLAWQDPATNRRNLAAHFRGLAGHTDLIVLPDMFTAGFSMAVDSLAAAIAAINVPATQSSALGSALSSAVNDWASATRDERIMARYFLFSFFKLHESAWYQRKAGSLAAIFDHAPPPVTP